MDVSALETALRASDSAVEQKQMVGQWMYEIIAPQHPQLAGKLVGMILGLDKDELMGLVRDEKALNEMVESAIDVLQKADNCDEGKDSSMDVDTAAEESGDEDVVTPSQTPKPRRSRPRIGPTPEMKGTLSGGESPCSDFKTPMSYAEAVARCSKSNSPKDESFRKPVGKVLKPKKLSFGGRKTPKKEFRRPRGPLKRKHRSWKDIARRASAGLLKLNPETSEADLAGRITRLLGEPKSDLIDHIVSEIGCKRAIEVSTETSRVLKQGGMQRADGKGYRSPGGVFLTVLKSYVPAEQYRAFYKHVRPTTPKSTPRKHFSIVRRIKAASS